MTADLSDHYPHIYANPPICAKDMQEWPCGKAQPSPYAVTGRGTITDGALVVEYDTPLVSAEQARALLEGAAPGPWSWSVTEDRKWAVVHDCHPQYDAVARCVDDDDAALIAAAPDLAATVVALHARMEAVRALHRVTYQNVNTPHRDWCSVCKVPPPCPTLAALDGEGNQPSVLREVAVERARQDAKWGEQNHPDGTGPKQSVWNSIGLPSRHSSNRMLAVAARDRCQKWAELNVCTYEAILTEEWAEVLESPAGSDALRAELIQVAAVAVAWAEKIDRERAALDGEGNQ